MKKSNSNIAIELLQEDLARHIVNLKRYRNSFNTLCDYIAREEKAVEQLSNAVAELKGNTKS